MKLRLAVLAVVAGSLACGGATGPGKTYSGAISGQLLVTTSMTGNVTSTCLATNSIAGTLSITIEDTTGTSVQGRWLVKAPETETSNGGGAGCVNIVHGQSSIDQGGTISGTTGNIVFTGSNTSTGNSDNGTGQTSTMTVTATWNFTGALSAGVITGTMSYNVSSHGTSSAVGFGGSTITGGGSTSFAASLH